MSKERPFHEAAEERSSFFKMEKDDRQGARGVSKNFPRVSEPVSYVERNMSENGNRTTGTKKAPMKSGRNMGRITGFEPATPWATTRCSAN